MSNLDVAVLIIAYRRHANLKKILDYCLENEVTNVYVALDAPKDAAATLDVQKCLEVIEGFKSSNLLSLKLKRANSNLGCSISVLTACDWVFCYEDFALIMEDDCLPSNDFFRFAQDGLQEMQLNPRIGMLGGSQFAPIEITANVWSLSDYPLIWGWGTSKIRWNEIRDAYLSIGKPLFLDTFESHHESVYWYSGTRRAVQGFVDAWDTPLVYVFKQLDLKALLPGRNLVTNVGNDAAAIHTKTHTNLLNRDTQKYFETSARPMLNSALNHWQRKELFRISIRHVFSTKFTRCKDWMFKQFKKQTPLITRWKNLIQSNDL